MSEERKQTSDSLVERLRAPAFWFCESDEGHPGDATRLVHEAADAIAELMAVLSAWIDETNAHDPDELRENTLYVLEKYQ